MIDGVLPIVIDKEAVAATLYASTARTVKVEVPVAVGVPEITPVDVFKVNPAGSDPTEIDQVTGATPPEVCTVAEYDLFIVDDGNDAVAIASTPLTVMLSDFVAVPPSASVAVTVKVDVPAVVGVPEMVAPDNVRPAGNVPVVTLHVYGVEPPLAANVCEYAADTSAAARDAVVTEGAENVVTV